MKTMKTKLTALLLLLCLLLCTFSFTACSAYDLFFGKVNAEDGTGDAGGTKGDGSPDTTPNTDVPDNDTTENGAADNDSSGDSVADNGSPDGSVSDDDVPDDGTTDSSTSDNTQSTPSESVNNTITITGSKADTAYAAAKGLRSAVSVYCAFQVTTGGSRWYPSTTQTYYSTGSGVLYRCEEDGSAFVVTNFHVVYNSQSDNESHVSEQIYLYLYGMEYKDYAIPATYVGGSANYDIAVLRVDESEVLKTALASGSATAVTLSDTEDMTPGETVIAIGNPSSTDLSGISVTVGTVSVDSESITMTSITGSGETKFRVIRTDTAVNSGNSGGGMFNAKGDLVGIVNAKITSSSIDGIAYAIPVSVARGVADNIIDHCYETSLTGVYRASLGIAVEGTGLSTVYDPQTGLLTKKANVSVVEITEGSAAEGKLAVNDIILSVTIGEKTIAVTRVHHVIDAMLDARVGDTVTLTVLRNGVETTVSIHLTDEQFAIFA